MLTPRTGSATQITVVTAEACHLCTDAQAALSELEHEFDIVVHLVEIRSALGQDLVRLHRPAMNPLVLIDDRFFSAGRLPRGKLRKMLGRDAASVRVG